VAFSERIRLVIDVATGNASGPLKKLSTDLKNADGAFKKVGVAAKGMGDLVARNLATFAVAGAAGLVAFAAKAVDAFQKTALGAGELRDALGVTAEEASRFQEVADDLGIGVEALQSALGKMNRAAADTPEAFAAIGAEIQKNADGTTNVTETFLEVVDALNRIPDATARASAAQKIFGRGWQNISELVASGADAVREAMASVEGGKIISDAEVDKARELRDKMDELKGVFEEVAVEVGSALVPALTAAADVAKDIAPAVEGISKAVGVVTGAISDVHGGVEEFEDSVERGLGANISTDNITISARVVEQAMQVAADRARDLDGAVVHMGDQMPHVASQTDAATVATRDYANASEVAAAADERRISALEGIAGVLMGQVEGAAAVAAANREYAASAQSAADATAATVAAVGEFGAASAEAAAAATAEADAIIQVSQASVGQYQAMMAAAGATATATGALDAQNAALLTQASTATPAARAQIVAYIADLNAIPPEVTSEILALLDQGKVAEAEARLNETSRSRDQVTTAEAVTGGAEADLNEVARARSLTVTASANTGPAESAIQNLIRTRNMVINAQIVTSGGAGYGGAVPGSRFAEGTDSAPGGRALVGEEGPEVVDLPRGSRVHTALESAQMMSGGGSMDPEKWGRIAADSFARAMGKRRHS
jgi:hypothetical protein